MRRELERRWRQFDEQSARMSEIIRRFGLAEGAIDGALTRSMGVSRREVRGENFLIVNNDTVEETRAMPANGVDLIVTSIPFRRSTSIPPATTISATRTMTPISGRRWISSPLNCTES